MDRDYNRLPIDSDDVGSARTSTATSLVHPVTRTPTSSERRGFYGDDEPEIHARSGYNGNIHDHSAAPRGGDCGYSKPFLLLDMIWNLAFVLVSVFVMISTVHERPSTPLRLWIFGYALLCILHMWFVWAEYQRRNLDDDFGGFQDFHFNGVFSLSSIFRNRIIKKLGSVNTILSSIWWVFGFYWIVMGGQSLLQDSPRLYWLSFVFLAFDVFFMIFFIVVACVIFVMLFCCFPILATVAYAMTIGEGASENDLRSLPKYLYRQSVNSFEDHDKQFNINPMAELSLSPEDSECCICLHKYTEGVELCTLACNHHFHHKCITKWLRINATCPLCKFNILRGDMLV